jgi:hypothetical protein
MVMKSFDLTEQRSKGLRKPSQEERLIDEVLAMELSPDMSEQEVAAAKGKIERARAAISNICNVLRTKIDEFEQRISDGERVDPDWWSRLNGASRHKSWQRQQLQSKLAHVNRLARAFQHQTATEIANDRRRKREKLFVQIAELHLSPETTERLWKLVADAERAQQQDSA